MSIKYQQLIQGSQLAIQGFENAVSTGKIRRYFYKSFIFLAVSMTLLYLIVRAFIFTPLFVIKAINWVLSFLFEYNGSGFEKLVDGTMQSVNDGLVGLPLSGLFLVRYVYPYPMNNIFLVSVMALNKPYYDHLSEIEYKIDYWGEIRQHIKRSGRRLLSISVVFLVSKLPYIGQFAIPLASIYLTSKSFGPKIALALAAIPLIFPSYQPLTFSLLKSLYGTRALARELLEPYFGRLDLNAKQRRLFFADKQGLTLGFAFGFYLLIAIPLIGPIFYVIAQSAIATFLVNCTPTPTIKASENSDNLDMTEPTETSFSSLESPAFEEKRLS